MSLKTNDELGSIIAQEAVGATDVLGEKIRSAHSLINSDHGPPALHSVMSAAGAFCFAKAPIQVFIRHAQTLALASVWITGGDDRNH